LTSYIVIRRQKTKFDLAGYVVERCLHSLRPTSDLHLVDRPTNFSSNVNVQLALRWHHAYGRNYYAVVNQF